MTRPRTVTAVTVVLAAVALVGVAVVHLRIARNYVDLGTKPFSLGDQFYAQSGAAILLALVLVGTLIRPLGRFTPLVWLGAAGFGVVSLGFLVFSRYHSIPVPGLPGGFQESWGASGAKPAAWFESVAIVVSLAGLVLSRPTAGSADGSADRPATVAARR